MKDEELERRLVTRGLRIGVVLSSSMILLGLLSWGLEGFPELSAFHGWNLRALPTFRHPSGFLLNAGILILVLTPILRVALLAYGYFRIGNRRFATISLGVLALLALSALLGGD